MDTGAIKALIAQHDSSSASGLFYERDLIAALKELLAERVAVYTVPDAISRSDALSILLNTEKSSMWNCDGYHAAMADAKDKIAALPSLQSVPDAIDFENQSCSVCRYPIDNEGLCVMDAAHVAQLLAQLPAVQPVPVVEHPFEPCGYKYCDWPDGELRCNERVPPNDAEAERTRVIAYLSYDTVYSDDFCVRCSHCPSNCECAAPVYMAGWEPDDKLKSLKVCLFQEDFGTPVTPAGETRASEDLNLHVRRVLLNCSNFGDSVCICTDDQPEKTHHWECKDAQQLWARVQSTPVSTAEGESDAEWILERAAGEPCHRADYGWSGTCATDAGPDKHYACVSCLARMRRDAKGEANDVK